MTDQTAADTPLEEPGTPPESPAGADPAQVPADTDPAQVPADTPEAPDAAPATPQVPTGDQPDDDGEDDDGTWRDWDPADREPAAKVRREAKGLRDRLHALEAAHTDTLDQVDQLQQQLGKATARADAADQAVRLVRERNAEHAAEQLGLVLGDDLWRHGIELDSLHDEGGGLDPARVLDAVRQIRADRPHLCRPVAHTNPDMDAHQLIGHGVQPAIDAPAEHWSQYRLARAKAARGGATAAQLAPAGPQTITDILRAALPQR